MNARRRALLVGALVVVMACKATPSAPPESSAPRASASTPSSSPIASEAAVATSSPTSWTEVFSTDEGSLGALIEGPEGLMAAGCIAAGDTLCAKRIVVAEGGDEWGTVGVDGPADMYFDSLHRAGDRLFAVGYGHYGRRGGAVVWTSTDGRAWTQVPSDTFEGRWVQNIIESPAGTLAVGYSAPIESDNTLGFVTWPVAADGSFGNVRNVDQLGDPALLTDAVWTGREFLAWGYRDGPYADGPTALLASEDGRTWTARSEVSAVKGGGVAQILVAGKRLVAVGSEGRQFPLTPRAWTSDDGGRTWTLADVETGPGSMETVAKEGSMLIARGGDLAGETMQPLAWSSRDGTEWDLLDADVGVPSLIGFFVRGVATTAVRTCISGTFFDASPARGAIYCRPTIAQ